MNAANFVKVPVYLLAVTVVVIGATGCKSKKTSTIDTGLTDDQSSSRMTSPTVDSDRTGSIPLSDVDFENLNFSPNINLQPIYFAYDSSALQPDAQATLRQNYEFLEANPGLVVLIEGHCDERGTQEYNLALGERRALAAREYLVRLGADPRRLTTVSYGEERPAEMGSNEQAWAKNRRSEFKTARP